MHLLKAIQPTVIKRYPSVSADFVSDADKFNLSPNDPGLLVHWVKPIDGTSHYEFELLSPINGFYNWFAFDQQIDIQAPPKFWIKAEKNTVIKRFPISGEQLDDANKFNFMQNDQPLQVNWIRQVDNKHYELELTHAEKGFYKWFAFVDHVSTNVKQLVTA